MPLYIITADAGAAITFAERTQAPSVPRGCEQDPPLQVSFADSTPLQTSQKDSPPSLAVREFIFNWGLSF